MSRDILKYRYFIIESKTFIQEALYFGVSHPSCPFQMLVPWAPLVCPRFYGLGQYASKIHLEKFPLMFSQVQKNSPLKCP